MKFLIAPDSFKGSLAAPQAAKAIAKGLKRAWPQADLIQRPLADGGEGSVQILQHALGGTSVAVNVQGPLGQTILAQYALLNEGRTAVIEVAQASGLTRLGEAKKDPLKASSFGSGQLILDALDRNVRNIWLCLGGSATVEGGLGIAMALGARGFDARSNPISPDGQGLIDLDRLDLSGLDPRLDYVKIIALCDVTNVLSGAQGARVYMAQKGATPGVVAQLESALARWEQQLAQTTGKRVADLPGAGAAGGIGAGVAALLDAELVSGVEFILDALRFERALERVDLVISGEGRIDEQTAYGKVVAGVARRSKRQNVPLLALCGEKSTDLNALYECGVTAILPIVPGPVSILESIANTALWLEDTAFSLGKLLKAADFPERR